jgi:enoyl-CoA hydratase
MDISEKKEYEFIIYEVRDRVGWITLNDPKKHNALNKIMQLEIKSALLEAEKDEKVRVIVFCGSGERSFCVGADIHVFSGINSLKGYKLMRDIGYEIHRLMERIEKPIIAAVNGYCMAGGLELALACDLILATEDSIFSAPEINLGIIPGWGGTVRLPRAVPVRKAKEWIMTGDQFSAEEAHQLGLINRIASKSQFRQAVEDLANKLASKSSNALRMAKMSINCSLESADIDAALAIERGAISVLFGTEDCQEGVQAFLEKRKPNFTGK